MLTGGINIPESLDIAGDVVGNAYFRQQIIDTKKEVSDGNSITTVFVREGSMPDMIPQMMSVGEETGPYSRQPRILPLGNEAVVLIDQHPAPVALRAEPVQRHRFRRQARAGLQRVNVNGTQ